MNRTKLILILTVQILFSGMYAQTGNLQELLYKKKFADVLDAAKAFTATDSTDFQKMYIVGQAYEGLLKYREALSTFQTCYEQDSLNIDLLNTLGRTATNLGSAPKAQFYFNKVLDNDPTNFYAHYQLARLYFQLGDYNEAIDRFAYLLEEDPTNPTLLKMLGDSFIKIEEFGQGMMCYFTAFIHNRENAGLASTLINCMMKMGEDMQKEAIAVCDTALYYNPGNVQLLRNKGFVLYANKLYEQADTIFTDLLVKGDSTYNSLKYGGSARYYAGKFYNAIHPLEIAYAMDTTSVDVCLLLGSALGKTYDRKQGLEMLTIAEKNMQPQQVYKDMLLVFRAETYQKDGNYKESAKLYYQAWNMYPNRIGYLNNIAGMYGLYRLPEDEDTKQRAVFANQLFVSECLRADVKKNNLIFYKKGLEKLYEDMFFRGVEEQQMIAPDGKKSTITIGKIRELINQIPDPPKKEDKIESQDD